MQNSFIERVPNFPSFAKGGVAARAQKCREASSDSADGVVR